MEQLIDPDLALRIVRDDPNPIAYDTETTGLSVKDVACGYVVTNTGNSIYVPVRHEAGGNIPGVADFERALGRAFEDRSRAGFLTVGHNLGFDLRVSLRHGIRLWHPLEDTMINQALINDLTAGYGLDDCCVRWNVTAKKGDALYKLLADTFGGIPDRKQMKNFWRLPGDHPVVVDYATGDGVSTLELRDAMQPAILERIGERGDNPGYDLTAVHALESRLLPYLARMHHRGIRVDMEYGNRVLEDELPAQIVAHKEKFPEGFNPRSPKEVADLFRANGYTDSEFNKTPTGQPSFREDWLEQNEIGEAILDWRRLEKLRDSFITPLMDTHNVDGRVHSILNQSKSDDFGVAGARLSCSEPNLQAFPKRNKAIGQLVRPLLIPDFGKIFEDDFSQQEPRLFTHYSECVALLEGYRSGTMDIHDLSNHLLFDNTDRDKAKRLGMGMLTMLGIPELARRLRVDEGEAKRLKRAFLDDAFPEIRDLQQDIIATFGSRGFVFSILKRRAYLENKRFAYQGVSRVIQNSGGDHMKTALLALNEYEDAHPEEFQILMTIHDSFLFQTENIVHAKEAQVILESAAQKLELILPIPVDVGFGDNWSEASYIKRGKKWQDTFNAK